MAFDENRDKLIFELIQGTLQREWEGINDLDEKAANLVGFTGIIISLLLSSAPLWPPRIAGNYLLLFAFMTAFILLFMSFGLALWGYMVRQWELVPNPIRMIRSYADRSYEDLLLAVGGEMAKIVEEVRLKSNSKASRIRASSYLLGLGLVAALIFALMGLLQ